MIGRRAAPGGETATGERAGPRRLVTALVLMGPVALTACGLGRAESSSGPVSSGAGPVGSAQPVAIENNPPGAFDGAEVLERSCTECHGLGGLTAYSAYWGEPEWRSMIETMVGYGAVLTPEELDVLARYLGVNYGTAGSEPTG